MRGAGLGMPFRALALVAVCAACPGATQGMAPVTEWQLRQEAESCRVFRAFGGTDLGFFQLRSFGPGSAYELTVANAAVPKQPAAARIVEVHWNGKPAEKTQVGLLGTVSSIPSLTMLAADREVTTFGFFVEERGTLISDLDPTSNAIEVRPLGSAAVALQMGSLAEPLRQLAECETGLMEKWGWGRDYSQRVPIQPKPIDPQNFFYNAIQYPAVQNLTRVSSLLQLRLKIDAAGKVAQCVVQSSPGSSVFGSLNCDRMRKAGRFVAARDARGQPVASYQQISVTFARFD